ncbi:TPA: hypothetical protein KOT48_003677 [Clostridioides difficile]|nr:hypothetical protein [Clostridioides difficile]
MEKNKFIKLTEEEVKNRLEKLWDFLQYIHPELGNKKYISQLNNECVLGDLAIEIRALKRVKGESSAYCNHRIYNFSDSQKKKLYEFLKKLNNKEIPYCMYYSVFNFNSKVMGVSKSGNVKEKWNNCVCINNSISTHILVMDFDDITEEEFIKYRLKLSEIGLDTSDIFSGHGYQCIIKLNQLCLDKNILTEFTNKLLSKGFPVDKKIKDSARIMRNPYTDNSKGAIKDMPIISTDLCYKSSREYSVEEIFNKLDRLPTVISIETPIKASGGVKIDLVNKHTKIKKEVIKEVKTGGKEINKKRLTDMELEQLYPMLNIKELPDAVKLMLSGFQEGKANNVLMFITLYLKEQGIALSVITDIINTLKDLDTYNYSWEDIPKGEVSRFYFMKDYTSKSVFLSELQDFGYVEYNFIDKSVITINNYIFSKLADISSSAFYIYIKLLEKENYDNTSVFTLNEISSVVGITKRRVAEHIDDLVKSRLLDKKRANRRNGEEYKFFLSRFEQHKELGFTKFNIATLKLLLTYVEMKKINTTQLSICMYIKYICYNGKQNCSISQENLGIALGVNRTTITKAFKSIEDVMLIRRDAVKINDFQFKYNYTIHY